MIMTSVTSLHLICTMYTAEDHYFLELRTLRVGLYAYMMQSKFYACDK